MTGKGEKPIMVSVNLSDIIEMKQFVKEAKAPKIPFTGNIKEMKEEADQVIKEMLIRIEAKLNQWVR